MLRNTCSKSQYLLCWKFLLHIRCHSCSSVANQRWRHLKLQKWDHCSWRHRRSDSRYRSLSPKVRGHPWKQAREANLHRTNWKTNKIHWYEFSAFLELPFDHLQLSNYGTIFAVKWSSHDLLEAAVSQRLAQGHKGLTAHRCNFCFSFPPPNALFFVMSILLS